MKVLVIPTWYPSGEDKLMGAYHKDFTEALNKNNIEADMLYISRQRLSKPFKYFFMKKREIEKEKNYNVYHYKILNYGPISFDLAIKTYTNALYKAVKDYIKINGKPDILHAQVTLPAGYATYIVGQKLNIPVVITEHCGNLERFFREPLNKYTNQLLNKVTYSCVSSYMQKVALKYMDKCYVLPNLVNIDNYQNYGKRKINKTFNLVSLCALREGKKIDNIFKAIKEIKDIDIHLDVIGDGFYEKYYKDKCRELGMDNKVTFLGRKNKKEINEIFKSEHALVISSEIESFAIPGIEALATGIPVVSTKCLGPEEYIDESNGVLCEKNDVQSLKNAIIKLYNNYDKYDPLKLRESIVRFSEKEVAGKAYEIYKEAICKKVILCILDGVGIREKEKGNAFLNTDKKTFNYLWNNYPHSLLEASGEFVGLPNKQMGNSEVGHTNIGAGRIVYQSLELINKSIKDKSFYDNENILDVINHTKKNNSNLHIFGLLSDGGIHSHINHLYALLELCKKENVQNVYIHAFLDGRDTLPNVSIKYLDELTEKMKELNVGVLSTISGRYYSMDRDNNYDRIKLSYDAIVYGKGNRNSSYKDVINSCYEKGIYDEFIIPTIINEKLVNDNDGLILFNYRPDRARELFTALTNKDFNEFDVKRFNNIKLVTMMPVADSVVCSNAFKHEELINTLGEYIDNLGLKQLRIAETEKYAHVTYFFDGGIERDLKNSKRILIPSPSVKTYDLKPEMSAYLITDTLMKELDNNYDLVVLNYANGDMVGHTGNYDATKKAVVALDNCLERLYKKAEEDGYTLMIIADHGNCDYMLDSDDNVVTSHSVSPVPCIITDNNYKVNNGRLCDVAPTLLNLMGLSVPNEMTGECLIERRNRK